MPFSLRGRKTRSDVCWKLIFGYVMYFDTFFPFLLKLVFKKVRIDGFDSFFQFCVGGSLICQFFFFLGGCREFDSASFGTNMGFQRGV